jgi:hypothetical protein
MGCLDSLGLKQVSKAQCRFVLVREGQKGRAAVANEGQWGPNGIRRHNSPEMEMNEYLWNSLKSNLLVN